MNEYIKTELEIYGLANKKLEDTTNMSQSLKDMMSEQYIPLSWLKAEIEKRGVEWVTGKIPDELTYGHALSWFESLLEG